MIIPRGDIRSPIWLIMRSPSDSDNGAGTPISGTEGFHLDKLFDELSLPAPYITTIEQNSLIPYDTTKDGLYSFLHWLTTLDVLPAIIGLYDKPACELLTPETRNYKKPYDTKLDKWAGSLLISPLLNWPHYCIPLWPVTQFFIDWSYRDVYKFVDLGKVKDVYDYHANHGNLMPIPAYNLVTKPPYNQLVDFLDNCRSANYISVDVETLRPPKGNKSITDRTGYIYTVAIAPNSREAYSFSLWNYPTKQCCQVWQKLNWLLKNIAQIGQNYFSFDAHYFESLGFELCLDRCQDTRIRHQLLWPELPHSLQFQCKQYTYQKFYKDDGKTWSPKYIEQLMRYNALDAVVTYEIYEKQEEEFAERGHLK